MESSWSALKTQGKEALAWYTPAVQAYLETRWAGGPVAGRASATPPEVFAECEKHSGTLQPTHGGDFRKFLLKMTIHVAQRVESDAGNSMEGSHDAAKRSFDHAWAHLLMRQAAIRQGEIAQGDSEAVRRHELLRLHIYGETSFSRIGQLWKMDETQLKETYAQAEDEFQAALFEVARYHHPQAKDEIEDECNRLIGWLEKL